MEPLARQMFLALYNGQVEAIFRYHLVRSGDWTSALSLTADTFFGALDWYNSRRAAPAEAITWLWKIAVSQQSRQNPRTDGLEFAGESHPSQAQISTFAQAAQVMSQWQPLSRLDRDALALHFFGGLSPEQVVMVLGGKGDRVRELSMQHGSPAMFDLSQTVRLVGYFQQRLENALHERAESTRKHRLRLGNPFIGQPSYRARSTLVWALRLGMMALLVYLLATAWNSFQHANAPLSGPVPTAAPLPKITETPDFLFSPLQDRLVIADQTDQLRIYSTAQGTDSLALSPVGFYPDKNLKPTFPPLVSPDGKWLVLGRPVQEDTWLLSLDGKHQILVSNHQVKVDWSPDSLDLLSIDPQQAGRVEIIDVQRAVSAPVFVEPLAQVLSAAFSPDGGHIGLAYQADGLLHVALISTIDKDVLDLVSLPAQAGLSAASFDLFFTSDGKEIWLPALRSAVTVPEGEVRPLEAEPYADASGARGQRLGLNEIPPMAESSILSPDGYKAAVVLRRLDNNAPGILSVYNGPQLATQRWMTYYGQIDALAWATDSASIFLQRAGAAGPNIMRIDIQSRNNVTLLEKARLIGSVDMMRQMASQYAPRTELVRGEESFSSDNNLRTAVLPGNLVSFRIPQGWRLWAQGDGNPDATAIAANFSFVDSLGWAALPPGYVMIGISEYAWNDNRPLAQLVESYAGSQPGQAVVKRFNLDGHEAYRLDFLKKDGSREPVVYFRTTRGDVSIWILHGAGQVNPYFDAFIQSVRLSGEQSFTQVEATPRMLYP